MRVQGILFFTLSFIAFAAGIARFIVGRHTQKLTQRLLTLTIAIIVAILLARFGLSACGVDRLSPSFFVEIMQAFSLDADYGILNELYPALGGGAGAMLVLIYLAILYSTAPITGGAIVYDVLAGVSPSIRLWFLRRRPAYIFSEINAASVTLAENIAAHHGAKSPIAIVFADVDGAEDDLMMRVSDIGGIYLAEDVHHVSLRRARHCSLFLMRMRGRDDFDEEKNLTDLYTILKGEEGFFWNAETGADLFFFSNDSEIIECVRDIKARYDAEPRGGTVSVNVIRPHAQAACTQLKRAPLFRPLDRYAPGKKLRVAIFGDSPFAREIFKTAFWCGQLAGVQLYISVICRPGDDVPGYETWLNRLSPEIIESCTWGTNPPECLRLTPEGEGPAAFAAPYCGLSFIVEDPQQANLRQLMTREQVYGFGCSETYRLCDCDYFFVMGGDDQQNLALASGILSTLVYGGTAQRREGKAAPTLSVEIRSTELQQILSDRFRPVDGAPEIVPFGSFRERYSWENVFLDEAFLAADEGAITEAAQSHGFADISQSSDSIYDTWSEVGRCFHLPYKCYCVTGADLADGEAREALISRLTWLEHRRWNAFLRMQGFTRPFDRVDAVVSALREGGAPRAYAYKNVSGRLHPCLVECSVGDTRVADRLADCVAGMPDSLAGLDALDVISMARTRIEGKIKDIKQYDRGVSQALLDSMK